MAGKLIKVNGKVVTVDGNPILVDNENLVKKLIQERKNAVYLFSGYGGVSVDEYIDYDSTYNVTSTSYMFHQCTALTEIPLLNTSKVTNMSYMFYGCKLITTIPLLDTSKVTSMANMFYNCYKLTEVPLLDTSSVTSMTNMFTNCTSLTTIPLLDTSNVANMASMFRSCSKLSSIPSLDTSSVTSFESMLRGTNVINVKLNIDNATTVRYICMGCDKLKSIDFSTFSSTILSTSMANGCSQLIKFIIRNLTAVPKLENVNAFANCYHLTGTVNETYNPDGLKDGRIYIPDEWVDQVKAATNWSTFADVIVPLSTLEE